MGLYQIPRVGSAQHGGRRSKNPGSRKQERATVKGESFRLREGVPRWVSFLGAPVVGSTWGPPGQQEVSTKYCRDYPCLHRYFRSAGNVHAFPRALPLQWKDLPPGHRRKTSGAISFNGPFYCCLDAARPPKCRHVHIYHKSPQITMHRNALAPLVNMKRLVHGVVGTRFALDFVLGVQHLSMLASSSVHLGPSLRHGRAVKSSRIRGPAHPRLLPEHQRVPSSNSSPVLRTRTHSMLSLLLSCWVSEMQIGWSALDCLYGSQFLAF